MIENTELGGTSLTQDKIVDETKIVRNGLRSLRDDHFNIVGPLREEFENVKNTNTGVVNDNDRALEQRLRTVNDSIEKLEIGIEESSVLIGLSEHFQRIESDRSVLRLEMGRITDENDWLREELTETQRKLKEAYEEIEELHIERREMQFNDEIRNMSESNLRPITPSKIPVGAWRVEEEKAINSALDSNHNNNNTIMSTSNKTSRSSSPAPSRLPIGAWRTKVNAYKSVMEKKEIKEKAESHARNKRSYFKLNAPTSKIPSR
ncbi:kinesin light chain 1 [Lepeophtheirus salmonis]|nr:kinesin light chain 1-like [Lepeophtheirus salmonis]XP_040574930.1 kinesin light chain 1-like [Lepeophtheirus salmonis]XP_040574931.1 kinesin light chain 1-like [Lepeophtheirus salmonis]XP_040574932.1 kinesin light chain 1-like [Lepeophtheirus salmonis]XP_040574933.1 kinesin light chain 1-like [Lepeophtheirus salmonis]